MRSVRINQGRSTPLVFRVVGSGVILFISIKTLGSLPETLAIMLTMFLSFILPMLWFTFNILTIDRTSKLVHHGIWIMGKPISKPKKFNEIERIYIEKAPLQNTINRTSSKKSPNNMFSAYITFDDQSTYYLIGDRSEENLQKKILKIKEKLGFERDIKRPAKK